MTISNEILHLQSANFNTMFYSLSIYWLTNWFYDILHVNKHNLTW